jgi:hypothetical protein
LLTLATLRHGCGPLRLARPLPCPDAAVLRHILRIGGPGMANRLTLA